MNTWKHSSHSALKTQGQHSSSVHIYQSKTSKSQITWQLFCAELSHCTSRYIQHIWIPGNSHLTQHSKLNSSTPQQSWHSPWVGLMWPCCNDKWSYWPHILGGCSYILQGFMYQKWTNLDKVKSLYELSWASKCVPELRHGKGVLACDILDLGCRHGWHHACQKSKAEDTIWRLGFQIEGQS